MPSDAAAKGPGLKRVLGLWALVIYGIILIQPTAPMAPYGIVCETAHGHVVTTILMAMVAMLFTAISYGRMANAYPSAGSAYTYVGQELHACMGLPHGLGDDLRLRHEPDSQRDLLQHGDDEPCRGQQLLPAFAFSGLGTVFCRALHAPEPAGHRIQLTDQCTASRGFGSRGGTVPHGGGANRLELPRSGGGTILAAVLRSADFLLGGGVHGDLHGHADLYRLRRHLDALGGGAQSCAAISCWPPC